MSLDLAGFATSAMNKHATVRVTAYQTIVFCLLPPVLWTKIFTRNSSKGYIFNQYIGMSNLTPMPRSPIHWQIYGKRNFKQFLYIKTINVPNVLISQFSLVQASTGTLKMDNKDSGTDYRYKGYVHVWNSH